MRKQAVLQTCQDLYFRSATLLSRTEPGEPLVMPDFIVEIIRKHCHVLAPPNLPYGAVHLQTLLPPKQNSSEKVF